MPLYCKSFFHRPSVINIFYWEVKMSPYFSDCSAPPGVLASTPSALNNHISLEHTGILIELRIWNLHIYFSPNVHVCTGSQNESIIAVVWNVFSLWIGDRFPSPGLCGWPIRTEQKCFWLPCLLSPCAFLSAAVLFLHRCVSLSLCGKSHSDLSQW